MKKLTEYSESLGLSKSNLGVYRTNRGFGKKTKARTIYEAYVKELETQKEARGNLQNIYYELQEKRGDTTFFARYLVSKGIIGSEKSLRQILEHSFQNINGRLVGVRYTERHIKIVDAYKEWRCYAKCA